VKTLCETCANIDACTYAQAARELDEKGAPTVRIGVLECRLYAEASDG
jgi:hypothetical protein